MTTTKRITCAAIVLAAAATGMLIWTGTGGATTPAHPVATHPVAVRPVAVRPSGVRADVPPPLPPADADVLHDAEQSLIRTCMDRAGFRYWTIPAPPHTRAELFPYVIDDVVWAARFGFGSDGLAPAAAPTGTTPMDRYLAGLAPARRQAFSDALNGPQGGAAVVVTLPDGAGAIAHSTTGCVTEAETRLYGDYTTWYEASTASTFIVSMERARVLGDLRYAAALKPWSACMAAAGLDYPDPSAASDAFPHAAPPTPAEVRAATAEARCADGTPLARTAAALDTEYLAALPASQLSLLDTCRRLSRAALPGARAVLTNG
jgi:hypothetical protein